METREEYLRAKIEDRRREVLEGHEVHQLQYLAQNYDISDKSTLIDKIIEKGYDTKEYGQEYWKGR